MSLDGTWVPETKEEDRLMEDIHIATRRAHADGISRVRIAGLLSFMAAAAIDRTGKTESPDRISLEEEMSEEDRQSIEEAIRAMQEEPTKEPEECPSCGTKIAGVQTAMGGDVIARPCGCTWDWDVREQLGDWARDLEPPEVTEE